MKKRTEQTENLSKETLLLNELPNRLKNLRKKKGVTQEALAEYLSMDAKAYGKYEQGCVTPPIHIIINLADYYEVTTDYILMGKELSFNDKVTDLLNSIPNDIQSAVLDLISALIKVISAIAKK